MSSNDSFETGAAVMRLRFQGLSQTLPTWRSRVSRVHAQHVEHVAEVQANR
jgi:hypothetical protein